MQRRVSCFSISGHHAARGRLPWELALGLLVPGTLTGCVSHAAPKVETSTPPASPGGEFTAPGEGLPREPPQPQGCAAGAVFAVEAGKLTPAHVPDYLALRAYSARANLGDPNAWTRVDYSLLGEVGTRCATATRPSCAQTIAGHPSGPVAVRCNQGACIEVSVVTTRGEDVRRWATLAELTSLLAPIDTEHEALLLAHAAGYEVMCRPAPPLVSGGADGYEVDTTRYTETAEARVVTRHKLHVSRNGEIKMLAEEPVSSIPLSAVPE